MTNIPATSAATGIHWPTAQATSLQNVVFEMSSAPGTQHVGLFCESGMCRPERTPELYSMTSHFHTFCTSVFICRCACALGICYLKAFTANSHIRSTGSAGFMTDLVFNGGMTGAAVGNQQFTMRNMTFNNCVTA